MNETLEALLRYGFGYLPEQNQHHFLVVISSSEVVISEQLSWDEETGSREQHFGLELDGQVRVKLPRKKWDAIADPVKETFNEQLRRQGKNKPGMWRSGQNLLRRELGKELTLLAWAIQDADPAGEVMNTALSNWRGLVPEERWWLYTQTAAATGKDTDRNIGWRKAVRYALTENPLGSAAHSKPEYLRRAEARNRKDMIAWSKFDDATTSAAQGDIFGGEPTQPKVKKTKK